MYILITTFRACVPFKPVFWENEIKCSKCVCLCTLLMLKTNVMLHLYYKIYIHPMKLILIVLWRKKCFIKRNKIAGKFSGNVYKQKLLSNLIAQSISTKIQLVAFFGKKRIEMLIYLLVGILSILCLMGWIIFYLTFFRRQSLQNLNLNLVFKPQFFLKERN